MPPKKKATAKTVPQVTVTVLVPFNGMYRGDTATVELDDRVRGWAARGLVRVDDEDPAGPSSAEPADPGSVAPGVGGDGAGGDEPGAGSGTGGYGSYEIVDSD